MSLDSVAVEGDRFGSSRPESSLGIIINKLEAVNRTLTQKQQAWITPGSIDPHTGKLVSPVDPKSSCSQCGKTETPAWRAGPFGGGTLCNACGERWRRAGKPGQQEPTARSLLLLQG